MNSTEHNGTCAWRGLLQWLDACEGEASLARAMAVWSYASVYQACVAGDASVPQPQPGKPSVVRLTDQGRAKL